MNIVVVGAGVSGLSSAVRLLEAGHRVVILTREGPLHTTSSVAAATWIPFAVGGASATNWSLVSLDVFKRELAEQPTETGVKLRTLYNLLGDAELAAPAWKRSVNASNLATEDLPPGYVAGFTFESPVIDMSLYLRYLERRVIALGGRIEDEWDIAQWGEVYGSWAGIFADDPEALTSPRVIVNCAGLGARDLVAEDANDSSDGRGVRPARGQVVRVAANGFDRVILGEREGTHPTYIVPRINDIVLGGSYEEDKEMRAVDPVMREDILTRCAELLLFYDKRFAMSLAALVGGETAAEYRAKVGPEYAETPPASLASAPDDCGLRPVRAEVALKRQTLAPDRYVIHNYGHGGGGVTLSWGCAQAVADMAATL